MDPELAAAFQPYLQSGEALVWSGRPAQGLHLTGIDIFLIPFSLAWGGFAIVWEVMVVAIVPDGDSPKLLFALFGIPFVLVGLYLIVGRFFVDAAIRRRTFYGLTDRRALVLRRVLGERLVAAFLKATPQISLHRRPDGRGTVVFGVSAYPWRRLGPASYLSYYSEFPVFVGVDNAAEVYRLAEQGRTGEAG